MSQALGRTLLGVVVLACIAASVSAQQTTSSTETKNFEVIAVDGNQLVVRLPEGTKELTVPDDFRFNIDGQQMSVHQLKPGMRGTATITTRTTSTPVSVTEVKNGEVVQKSGSSIIVRTAEGFKVFSQGDIDKRGVRIMRGGQPATIADLNTGDKLTATIVTSKPPRIATQKEVQAILAGAPASAPASASTPAAPAVVQATTGTAGTESAAAAPARRLPKTASPVPLIGLAGCALLATAAVLRARRRRQR